MGTKISDTDFSHGLEELAGLINFRVGAWHDFGYEVPPAPECKPVPPLGERSAEAIKAGHEAIKSIDELTRQLYRLREQLTGELRQDEDVRADRVDAMLARRRQERQVGATVPAGEDTGLSPELVAPVGVLPWVLADDKSHWRTELPDGRTAVIRRVLGDAGESSLAFVPTVYESASDFVTGPECNGVLAAAHWVDGQVTG
jgi:hypothetical protein